jgi:hypothetical protein
MGLALSGGGIRSATLSLGLVQALSRADRLFDFDYLSTVSGGGYFGCFLSSLFLPDSMRGSPSTPASPPPGGAEKALSPEAIRRYVEGVLATDSNEDEVDVPSESPHHGSPANGSGMRNPIWWLREHGRYLSPNGPTD